MPAPRVMASNLGLLLGCTPSLTAVMAAEEKKPGGTPKNRAIAAISRWLRVGSPARCAAS